MRCDDIWVVSTSCHTRHKEGHWSQQARAGSWCEEWGTATNTDCDHLTTDINFPVAEAVTKGLVLRDLHLFEELEYWSLRQYHSSTLPRCTQYLFEVLLSKQKTAGRVLQCCSQLSAVECVNKSRDRRQIADCVLQPGAKHLSNSRVVVLLLVYSSRQNKHCNLGGMPNIPDISYFLTVNTAKITWNMFNLSKSF